MKDNIIPVDETTTSVRPVKNCEVRMKLGELSEEFCLGCGKGYDFCICDRPMINTIDVVGDFPLPDHPVLLAQNKQSFDVLYEALQEVRDIVHRGLRDGERGHKRALQQAAKVLEVVE